MTNVTPHTGEVASLGVARAKLAKVIELHTPHNAARNQALEAFGRALLEFEAAVREDEHDRHGDLLATAQAEAVDLQARAHADRVRAEAAEAALAAGPVNMSPPPPASISIDGDISVEGALAPMAEAQAEAVARAAMTPEQQEAHADKGIGILPGTEAAPEEKPTKRKK